MTQQQFHSLDQKSKIILLTEMPHIGERFEPDYTVLLFQMDGWLLEAYYHRRAGAIHFDTITHNWQVQRFVLLEKKVIMPDGTTAFARPGLLAYNWRRFASGVKHYFGGIQHLFHMPGIRQEEPGRRIA